MDTRWGIPSLDENDDSVTSAPTVQAREDVTPVWFRGDTAILYPQSLDIARICPLYSVIRFLSAGSDPDNFSCRQRQRGGMGTKQIRVSEDLYARVKSENRGDETLGETLERLVGGYSLTDFSDDAAELDLDFSVEEATDGSVSATPPSHE